MRLNEARFLVSLFLSVLCASSFAAEEGSLFDHVSRDELNGLLARHLFEAPENLDAFMVEALARQIDPDRSLFCTEDLEKMKQAAPSRSLESGSLDPVDAIYGVVESAVRRLEKQLVDIELEENDLHTKVVVPIDGRHSTWALEQDLPRRVRDVALFKILNNIALGEDGGQPTEDRAKTLQEELRSWKNDANGAITAILASIRKATLSDKAYLLLNMRLRAVDPYAFAISPEHEPSPEKLAHIQPEMGIGFFVARDGTFPPRILLPIPGTEAFKHGIGVGRVDKLKSIKIGDQTIEIEDANALSKVGAAIQSQKPGATIRATIERRDKAPLVHDFKLAEQLEPDQVVSTQLAMTQKKRFLSVIGIRQFIAEHKKLGEQFTDTTSQTAIAVEMARVGSDAIVLDLRGSSGGDFQESIRVASLFIDESEKMIRLASREKGRQVSSFVGMKTGQQVSTLPLFILTDAASASAAETLSMILQSHRRAVVIGDGRTFGKNIAQSTHRTEKGGTIRLTDLALIPNDGTNRFAKGVQPDIELASAASAERRVGIESHVLNPPRIELAEAALEKAAAASHVVDEQALRAMKKAWDEMRQADSATKLKSLFDGYGKFQRISELILDIDVIKSYNREREQLDTLMKQTALLPPEELERLEQIFIERADPSRIRIILSLIDAYLDADKQSPSSEKAPRD